MAAITSFVINNTFLTVLIFAIAFFITWVLYLQWQIWQFRKKMKLLFNGHKASDLEGVIYEQIKRLRQTEKELKSLSKFAHYLERMALKSVQKVGVVRFNPFKETGSDQSFSIALLDPDDNGLTISGLFTREGTRLYVKPLASGESKYPLTDEEREAIELAERNWKIKKIQR
jgi:cell division protein FtsL